MNTSLRLTVDEYDVMVAKGAFDGLSQKVQLIEGEIIAMNPAGPRHDHAIEFLTYWSIQNTDFQQIRVRIQSGLSLPEQDSRPEPTLPSELASVSGEGRSLSDEEGCAQGASRSPGRAALGVACAHRRVPRQGKPRNLPLPVA